MSIKINLNSGQSNPLWYNGYINICPVSIPNSKFIVGSPFDLNEVVDDGEAEEIRASDIIGFVNIQNIDKLLAHWASKLKHGGSIIIESLDVYLLGKNISRRTMTIENINAALYGNRQGCYSANFVIEKLKALGLKINSIDVEGIIFSIKATRP